MALENIFSEGQEQEQEDGPELTLWWDLNPHPLMDCERLKRGLSSGGRVQQSLSSYPETPSVRTGSTGGRRPPPL